MKSLVLTLIGPDRPGLVGKLADVVAAHDGNWEESRMASLGGEFAGLLRVTVTDARASELERALADLGDGLQVVVKGGAGAPEDGASDQLDTTGTVLELELVGQDRPGIVREISAALASNGVNVEELESEVTSAPMSGEALFKARATIRLPAGTSESDVRASLEEIALDLVVDVQLDSLR
ncbi:MAG: ACT domain-containing protein [Acidobacteriota bacterium]|nr:ACT domain-containing protein [Acidobacteriota bacterium]